MARESIWIRRSLCLAMWRRNILTLNIGRSRSRLSPNFIPCFHVFLHIHTGNVITKEECILLNEILGTKTPSGCYSFSRTDFEDKFTVPGSDKTFDGRDEEKHRKWKKHFVTEARLGLQSFVLYSHPANEYHCVPTTSLIFFGGFHER